MVHKINLRATHLFSKDDDWVIPSLERKMVTFFSCVIGS